MLSNILSIFLITFMLLTMSCASSIDVEKESKKYLHTVRNDKKVISEETKYEFPLRNFGRDLAFFNADSIVIGIYPVTNETTDRTIPIQFKRLLLTAASKLASSPTAFKYIKVIDADIQADIYSALLRDYKILDAPAFLTIGIEGSVTEADKIINKYLNSSIDATIGKGKGTTDTGISLDKGSGAKVLTLDLNAINKKDNSLFPLGYSSNTMILLQRDKGGSFSLYILGNGFSLGGNFSVNDSQSYALRMLAEFSLIQLLGRIVNVPYWHCVGTMNPDRVMVQYMVEEWDSFDKNEKIAKYAEIARMFFSYYVTGLIKNGKLKISPIKFDTSSLEGRKNTIRFIKLLCKFYGIKPELEKFDTYLKLFNEMPFCSYPRNKELEKFLLTELKVNSGFAFTVPVSQKKIIKTDIDKLYKLKGSNKTIDRNTQTNSYYLHILRWGKQ